MRALKSTNKNGAAVHNPSKAGHTPYHGGASDRHMSYCTVQIEDEPYAQNHVLQRDIISSGTVFCIGLFLTSQSRSNYIPPGPLPDPVSSSKPLEAGHRR